MLSGVMLSGIMLSGIMLSGIMLSGMLVQKDYLSRFYQAIGNNLLQMYQKLQLLQAKLH